MPSDLCSILSLCLPIHLEVTVYELASSPTKCAPLFLSHPAKAPHPTTRESRFFAVEHDSILIFAMEILVYKDGSNHDTTVFVSKADSSGYFPHELSSFAASTNPHVKLSVFRSIASAIIEYVVDGQSQFVPKPRITIALFARSQPQYLFSNSATNNAKHVLSDRSLIAWWCKTIDPAYQRYAKSASAKAYLLVPGSDRLEVQKLFPKPPAEGPGWTHGHPFQLDSGRDITVREAIPHFPDDPKSRFMEELNGEDVEKSTKRTQKWASITTIDQFWELMSYRQECSAGRCVGFLWIVIPGDHDSETERELNPTSGEEDDTELINIMASSSQEQTTTSQGTVAARPRAVSRKRSVSNPNPLLSPRKKSRTSNIPAHPRRSSLDASLVVDDKRYKRAFESLLLHSDFGTIEKARKSSRKWVDGAYAMAHGPSTDAAETESWGQIVKGKLEVAASVPVNAHPVENDCENENKQPQVNMLGAGLIRKKKKPT